MFYRSQFTWIKDFCVREDGPTAAEYALMLALIAVVCIVSITSLGQNANKTFYRVSNAMTVASWSSGAKTTIFIVFQPRNGKEYKALIDNI